MADKTDGYESGDKCPRCGGLVTIRNTVPPGEDHQYAQCAKCYWNTLPD